MDHSFTGGTTDLPPHQHTTPLATPPATDNHLDANDPITSRVGDGGRFSSIGSHQWRVISAAVLTAIAVPLAIWLPLGLMVAIAVLGTLMMVEWMRLPLAHKVMDTTWWRSPVVVQLLGWAAILLMIGLLFFGQQQGVTLLVLRVSAWIGMVGLIAGTAMLIYWLHRGRPMVAWLTFGSIYLTLGTLAAMVLFWYARTTFMVAVAMVIMVDTASYYGGRWIGGRKLAPVISPNKTWSGALSGQILVLMVGGIVLLASQALLVAGSDRALTPRLHLTILMVMVLLPVVALAGDLVESLYKRRCGVKDSGGMLPGHGGFLDRFDSWWAVFIVTALLNLIGLF